MIFCGIFGSSMSEQSKTLIYMLLLVPYILPSVYASKRENLNFSDTINTEEKYVHNKDKRTFLQQNEKKDTDSIDVGNVNILERQVIIDGNKKELRHIQRTKRQWNAIFAGVNAGMNIAGLSLTLVQTLSEGCMYFPSICKNKKRMEDIERQLVPMRAEYEKLYLHNKKEFLNIMTSNSNNAYILYYVNSTIGKANSLQHFESILSAKLELNFLKVANKYTEAQNVTSKEYLENVLGCLEYRISDINSMLDDQKKTMFTSIAMELMIGAAFNVVSHVLSKISKRKALNKKLLEIVTFYGVPLPTKRFYRLRRNNLKMSELQTRAALKEMVIRGKSETKANIKMSKRPTKTQVGLTVVGILFEIVSQVIAVRQWKTTADDIEKARINYEKQYVKFFNELKNIRKEKVVLAKQWSGVILRFNNSTTIFKTLMEGARNYSQFNANVGLSQLPINTSNPIFDINFKTLNHNTIQSAQRRVIGFLTVIDNNVKMLVDRMYARKIVYDMVLRKTDSNESIDAIFTSIKGRFVDIRIQAISEYGASLTKKDIVCMISLLRRDLQDYDFFPLVIFRPKCNLTIDEYKKNEQIANTRRNAQLHISVGINSFLFACKWSKVCLCPSTIAESLGISIENVINLIRQKADPRIDKYCGTFKCSCVDLK